MGVVNPIGGGGGGISYQKFKNSVNYFGAETVGGGGSTLTSLGLSANNLWGVPILFPGTVTISTIAFNIVTTGTATLAELGIYNNGSGNNNFPVNLVRDFGSIATTSSGIKSITGLNLSLSSGLYFLAMIMNGTCTIKGLNLVGASLGVFTDIVSGINNSAFTSQTFGALPSVFGIGTAAILNPSNPIPCLVVKLSVF